MRGKEDAREGEGKWIGALAIANDDGDRASTPCKEMLASVEVVV